MLTSCSLDLSTENVTPALADLSVWSLLPHCLPLWLLRGQAHLEAGFPLEKEPGFGPMKGSGHWVHIMKYGAGGMKFRCEGTHMVSEGWLWRRSCEWTGFRPHPALQEVLSSVAPEETEEVAQ